LGPTAPTPATIGTVFRVLGFDATAETTFLQWEVPDDWVEDTDVTLKIYWTNEAGDAVANTETVIFDISYSIIPTNTGTAYDANGASTGTVTYTQSGAGVDKESHVSTITIAHGDASNPIEYDYVMSIVFNRDTALAGGGNDTYSGDVNIFRWEIAYSANTTSTH
jgi:hypothetical protein